MVDEFLVTAGRTNARLSQVTIMCIRCLERLYAIHADKIGPFSDIMILVRSMASTKSTETQHRLLGLVATLLGVSADEDRHGKISIPENAEQLLNVESIGQLCQFVAWGHTNGEQVGNLLSTMLDVSAQQKSMITDGSRSGPGGNRGSEDAQVPTASPDKIRDSVCPPVWFISSTGRTPPPPETIKGSFALLYPTRDLAKAIMAQCRLSSCLVFACTNNILFAFFRPFSCLRAYIDDAIWRTESI